MPLIVEDGTGRPDAQTYVSEADAQAYAAARGLTLPADTTVVAQLLLRAMDYLEGLRARYKGTKTGPGVQALQWPRTDVVIDGADWPTNGIPTELTNAECELAVILSGGSDPLAVNDGRAVTGERIGALQTTYAALPGQPARPQVPRVDQLLKELLVDGGAGGLRVVRV